MSAAVTPFHYGPLSGYLKTLAGCPDLERLVSRIRAAGGPVMWLDSGRTHPVTGRWSLVGWAPWLTLTCDRGAGEMTTSAFTHVAGGDPFQLLRQTLRRYGSAQPSGIRGLGLWGWLSYETNRWLEALPPPQPAGLPMPEARWYAFRVVVAVDHLERRAQLVAVCDPHAAPEAASAEAAELLEQACQWIDDSGAPEPPPLAETSRAGRLTPTTPQAEFETLVRRAQEYIRAGDIYQANLSQRFLGPWAGDPWALYRRLRRVNPSPFAAFVECREAAVVSCSPERLVRVQDGRIDTRPIAGTRPRGEDAVRSLELLLSEKERAEHLMLVDLARNDLGRVSRLGTVSVDEFMTLETYSHVIHIVSDVQGALRDDADAVDVLAAVFPGGTITGCPKVRCMEILRELEPVARGLYTGSLGYVGFDGALDLNIAIRTLVVAGGQASFHVGAGIVADSDPGREYAETIAKGRALLSALGQPEPRVSEAMTINAADPSARSWPGGVHAR